MSRWHEEYKRRYAELKKRGWSFFPYAVFKDTVFALVLLIALAAVAYKFGAKLEDLADPTDTSYNPRPEWYFLFLFQALKLFPGRLEAVAAVVLPGLALLVLVLIPFLDPGPDRHPFDRPFWTGLGLAAFAGFVYLTWAGFRSPLTNPIVEKNPVAVAGQRLYREMNCYYCHAMDGRGGYFGPDLAKAVSTKSDEWLAQHFRDPQSVSPGSRMPKLNLLDEEIQELIAYLRTLGVSESYTLEAPKLFSDNCAVCHKIGNEGSDDGPNLSSIGSVREKSYIKQYINDPKALNPDAAMDGFKGQLTDAQIEDLARYLASLKSQ